MSPSSSPPPRHPFLSTTSCQHVVHSSLSPSTGTGTLIIQSDLTHPKLWALASGHIMNTRVLVPSTLYADMAMTASHHLHQSLCPGTPTPGLNVCAMEVHKTLIPEVPPPPEGLHIQLEAVADINKGEVDITVRSVTWDGELLQEHGRGTVRYEDSATWAETWRRSAHLVKGQIELLEAKVEENKAHKILRGLAYKLFAQLVQYAPKYQGMQEVILEREDTAATAKIRFQVNDRDGEFFCSPYFIDNLCHLSGFVVNASDVVSEKPLVFISHGWENLRFLRPRELEAGREYRSYVRMVPQGKGVSAGDVYVFEGEEVVAVLEGLKFQGIPQRLMDVLIPRDKR